MEGDSTRPNDRVQTPLNFKKIKIRKENSENEKEKKSKIKNFRRKKSENEKNKDFASCVMVCNIVRFDLRHFLGFLAGFYLFALQLIHFDKIRGLNRLKMRYCVSEYPNKHD